MRDKPSLNRNINSAPLHLFDQVSEQVLVYLTWLVSPSQCHYKIIKKKLFISLKHTLILGRDMPETYCRQNFNKKKHELVEDCYFSTYWI